MPAGVKVPKDLRTKLNEMRMEHRMSFEQIGRECGLAGETVRKVIKKGTAVRDVHAHALKQLLERYNRGELAFSHDRKAAAIEKENGAQP
jgi:hypothetical protein